MAAVLRIAVVAVVLAGVAASPPRPREQSWGQPLAANKSVPVPKLRDVSVDASTPALIAKYGYESETHTIKTSDGYLLTLHRIPNPGKPVVYLQHGLLCSSADWVVLGPEESLAYILFDAGYDVWMGNTRGNTYSRAHATLTPEDDAFWDFSWHEMGIYDIPEMIDFILAKTEQDSLVYIGHSQGTTAFFVMASLLPEYNDKVKAFIALAPVAYVHSVASLPLQFIAKNIATFGKSEAGPSTSKSTEPQPERPSSASKRKIDNTPLEVDPERREWSGYRVVDIDKILSEILVLSCCKKCQGNLSMVEKSFCGLSSKFDVNCDGCGCIRTFSNSEFILNNDLGKPVAEVNRRFLYAIHMNL